MTNGVINANYSNSGASTSDYYQYKVACRNSGLVPLDINQWGANGAPTRPTGREQSK